MYMFNYRFIKSFSLHFFLKIIFFDDTDINKTGVIQRTCPLTQSRITTYRIHLICLSHLNKISD